MGNCLLGVGTQNALIRVVAFDYEVEPATVTVVSKVNNSWQGMYQVQFPGLTSPIRYDRVGTVFTRHSSAPPLPCERPGYPTPAGTPSNHSVIQYAAVENNVSANVIKMIKMTEQMGSGTYHLNVNGAQMVYKKMGTVFMKDSTLIPGTNMFA